MVASGVDGGGENGDNGAMEGKKLGEIDHRDHVALFHEGEEKKVRSGSHGSGSVGRRKEQGNLVLLLSVIINLFIQCEKSDENECSTNLDRNIYKFTNLEISITTEFQLVNFAFLLNFT